ncbi:predicted protein [Nematostella vectensis]|uniref:SEA domain-containing protein n=1 Tax=Nematostella vectensis TaxID=45351 RepID=A7SKF3_NEMVE|nr:predicted protein [Nematostella vectensis]|eukprot:XP_001627891.1 predicted protein [Nematostella vectensis]
METMLVATNTMTTSPNAKTETMSVAAATVTSSPNVTTQTMPVITNTVTSTSIINSGTPTSAMASSASSTTEIRPSPTINHMSTTSAVAEAPTIVYIQFEVTFALEYRSEYSNSSSSEYRELALNLTLALTAVFKEKGRKGFQGIQILGFRKGSVVCSFLVVVDGSSNLDANSIRELLQAEKGQLGMYKNEQVHRMEMEISLVVALNSCRLAQQRNCFYGDMAPHHHPLPPVSFYVMWVHYCIVQCKSNGNRAMWVKVPVDKSYLIPVVFKHGFTYHHAEGNHAMLLKWLPDNVECKVPPYASHQIGVAVPLVVEGTFYGKNIRKILRDLEDPEKGHVLSRYNLTTCTFLILSVAFFLCTAPLLLLSLMESLGNFTGPIIKFAFHVLSCIPWLLNPVCHYMISAKFQDEIKALFCGRNSPSVLKEMQEQRRRMAKNNEDKTTKGQKKVRKGSKKGEKSDRPSLSRQDSCVPSKDEEKTYRKEETPKIPKSHTKQPKANHGTWPRMQPLTNKNVLADEVFSNAVSRDELLAPLPVSTAATVTSTLSRSVSFPARPRPKGSLHAPVSPPDIREPIKVSKTKKKKLHVYWSMCEEETTVETYL